jgi:hypothetical protein
LRGKKSTESRFFGVLCAKRNKLLVSRQHSNCGFAYKFGRIFCGSSLETPQKTRLSVECVKKTPLKPHLVDCWRIAPKENAAFVANMEDVLKRREDSEYIRKGTSGVFMFVEPFFGGGADGMYPRPGKGRGRTGRER